MSSLIYLVSEQKMLTRLTILAPLCKADASNPEEGLVPKICCLANISRFLCASSLASILALSAAAACRSFLDIFCNGVGAGGGGMGRVIVRCSRERSPCQDTLRLKAAPILGCETDPRPGLGRELERRRLGSLCFRSRSSGGEGTGKGSSSSGSSSAISSPSSSSDQFSSSSGSFSSSSSTRSSSSQPLSSSSTSSSCFFAIFSATFRFSA